MFKGVGEDSRHGAWHVDIYVEMCIFLLECVWMCEHGIGCALRWGSSPYRRFSLLGIAHPIVRPPFQVYEKTTLLRGREYKEACVVTLRSIFAKCIRTI